MNIKKIPLFILFTVVFVLIDQYTKFLATTKLDRINNTPIFKNILEFSYVENKGAAFGILQGKHILFYILTVIVLCVIFYVFLKTSTDKKYLFFHLSLLLIFSGALGNFLDRLKNKYVVDFIYFKPINFPVFNVADIYITIGTILLFFCIFVIYKNENII